VRRGACDLSRYRRSFERGAGPTSIAVRLPGDETILFDASSGTILLGQLQDAGIPVEKVRHLFVSHQHFDHAGGLAPLLISMASLPKASLTVYALPGTLKALRELLALTIPGVEDWLGARLGWREIAPEESILVGDAEVKPFLVDHSVECGGYRVAQNDSVLVFSADTRPCGAVIEHSRGAPRRPAWCVAPTARQSHPRAFRRRRRETPEERRIRP
jgi:ribonuclease BN (tRNA processing enzyme)